MLETLILTLPAFEVYQQLFLSSPRFRTLMQLVYQDLITFCLAAIELRKRHAVVT
jgi:hypothetical protein